MNPWDDDPINTKDDPINTKKEEQPWDNDELVREQSEGGLDYVTGFGGGFNEGMAEITGAPVDVTNYVLSWAGLDSKEPVMGSDWIKRQARKVKSVPGAGDPFYEGPDTTGGRILNRAGKELGATAIPTGATLRAARGVAPSVATNRGLIQREILDPVRRAPGMATVGETTAATGAGVGAGVAREAAPDSPTAEMAGQLIGGITPSALGYLPSAMVGKIAKKITSRFSPKSQMRRGQEAVSELVGGAFSESGTAGLKEAERLGRKAKGFKPSIAEATGNESLIAKQIEIEKSATGKSLANMVARRKNNVSAIEDFSGNAVTGDIDPEFVFDSAAKRIDVFGEQVDRLTTKNLLKQKKLASKLPDIDNLTTGKKIRDGIIKAKQDVSAKMSIRANELGISDANVSVPFNKWKKGIKEKYKPQSRFEASESVPDIYKKMIAEKNDIPTTFNDVKALRERISDDLIDSLGASNPDRRKVRFLTRLKQDVDELLNTLDDDIGGNYKQFRKEYFEEYIEPFESGAMFKVKSKDGTGFFKARNEVVADMFFKNQSAAKQFNSNFKNDPGMMDSMEASVLDDLRNTTVVDGVIDEKKFNTWKNKNRDSLKELPQIKSKVDDIENTQVSLIERQQQLAERRQIIENKKLVKQLDKFSKGDVPADKILLDSLKTPRRMKQLVGYLKGNKEALGALKRTVWEHGTQGDSEDIIKFLSDNKKSLELLYSKEHFQNLVDVSMMRSMVEKVPAPKGQAFVPKPLEKLEQVTGMGFPQMSTRWYAFKSGRLAKSYLAADIARAALYNKAKMHADDLFKTALYDPEVARDMAGSVRTSTFTPEKAKRLGTRLFALGLTYSEDRKEQMEKK